MLARRLVPRIAVATLLLATAAVARAAPADLEGRAAPSWEIPVWVGLPAGRKALEPADLRGRVVVLAFVDGATREGLDAFAASVKTNPDGAHAPAHVLILLANPRAAQDLDAEARRIFMALRVPVGVGASRAIVEGYGPPARPYTVVLDARGIVRFAAAGVDGARLRAVRDALEAARRPRNPLVGQAFGPVGDLQFVDGSGPGFSGRTLTVVRWWTMHCPHCRASVPALAALVGRYEADEVGLLPVYHYKGGSRPDVSDLRRYLATLGYDGPFAIDPGWRKLRDLMGRAGFDRATSVTFLVDREGRVVWAHPGPRLHASEDARYVGPDADLRALAASIDAHRTGPRRAEGEGR